MVFQGDMMMADDVEEDDEVNVKDMTCNQLQRRRRDATVRTRTELDAYR